MIDAAHIAELEWRPSLAAHLQSWRREMQRDPQCPHRSGVWVRLPIAGGNYQVRRQCLDCGMVENGARRHRANDHHLPLADEGLRAAHEGREAQARMRRAEAGEEWRRLYAAYLASDEWHTRRELVMARAGGRCEGCLQRPASEVHHLTYDHAGAEFSFELVALCAGCHGRWHHVPDDEG